MNAGDETNITDIELLPNGRICVFGTSLQVLDLLDELQGGLDEKIRRRLAATRDHTAAVPIHAASAEGQLNAQRNSQGE
jgi:hypothetical protein